MEHQVVVDVDAPAEKVWGLLADLEKWPYWTESMTKVERLDDGPLAVGSRARVKQPRLAGSVWTVTDLEPNKSFSWESKAPGVHTVADHEIEETSPATSKVTLRIALTGGLLAGVIGVLFGGVVRRYVEMEAEGLKRAAETRPVE